jgi:hypothetical protein
MFSGKKVVHRGKSQKPFSLGRIRGENEADEADRQSHLRDGERITGRNESEPTSGLETKLRSGGRAPSFGAKAAWHGAG